MSPPPKRTPEGDTLFFTALENGHPISAACNAADYSVASVYRWRKEEPEFLSRWREAILIGGDLLEEEADRRGRDGVDQPVYYRGEEVGQKKRYSDGLLLSRLKAIRPELYRDRPISPPAVQPTQVRVRIRDFEIEHNLVRLIKENKITLEDIDPELRKRIERLMKFSGFGDGNFTQVYGRTGWREHQD